MLDDRLGNVDSLVVALLSEVPVGLDVQRQVISDKLDEPHHLLVASKLFLGGCVASDDGENKEEEIFHLHDWSATAAFPSDAAP